MKIESEFTDPKEMDVTVTITTTLGEWSEMLSALNATELDKKYPFSRLCSGIGDVVWQVRKKVYATEDK